MNTHTNPQSQRPLPLILPSMGGHGFRMRGARRAVLVGVALVLALLFLWISKPRVAPRPIGNLHKNGVHGVYNLHARNGELLLFNFRAVEDGKLYRSSGLPRNHRGVLRGKSGIFPAAFFHRETFDFLRANRVRLIVTLSAPEDNAAAQRYFNDYGRQTGYKIRLVSLTTSPELAYARASRDGRRFGLRTAVEFINFMKTQAPKDGAVWLQGYGGKDEVGVVAAAYELWRNAGHGERDVLWQQVLERYLVSDVLIKRDKEAAKFAGKPYLCKDGTRAFVCAEFLENLRPDLERIAQVN